MSKAVRRTRVRVSKPSTQGTLKLRRYEGASQGKRTKGWLTPGSSANTANAPALVNLRNRSRDLTRNNPYAAKAVQVIPASVVGWGIMPQIQSPEKKVSKQLQFLWREWAESTDCDADGVNTFYGQQSLMMREVVEAGEVLGRRRRRLSSDNLPVPLQVQILEPDYIDTMKSGELNGGGFIIQGVEFNAIGRRVAYWLFDRHPGEVGFSLSTSATSRRVPAEDIVHLFRVDRAGQVRGIVWGAPVIIKLRDFDEYDDAQLTRQKVAACVTGFVRDIDSQTESETEENMFDKLEPGSIFTLPTGKDITFSNVPSITGYGEYASMTLQSIAAGYGVTPPSLTGDFSRINFSAGRMGRGEFYRNVEQWQWHLLIPRFCVPVWRWFREAAELQGVRGAMRATAAWTPPRREYVDPTREIPALVTEVRAGFKTFSEAVRENGYDPETHFEELRRDNERIDANGLMLDSDPRKIMKAGIAQSYVGSSDGEDKTPEDGQDANTEY